MRILFCLALVTCSIDASPVRKTISYEEIVSFEKPKQVALSPNGQKVAFVTQRGDLASNKNISAVYLGDSRGSKTEKLLDLDVVGKIIWQGNEKLFALGKKDEEYQILLCHQGENTPLVSSRHGIENLAISSDGKKLYYTRTIPKASSTKDSYVFGVENPQQRFEWEEIRCLDLGSRKDVLITRFPYENWFDYSGRLISDLQPSPDDHHLAILLHKKGDPSRGEAHFTADLIILDTQTSAVTKLRPASIWRKTSPCWVNSHELVFIESGDEQILWVWDLKTNQCSSVRQIDQVARARVCSLSPETNDLIIVGRDSLVQLSWDTKEIKQLELPSSLSRLNGASLCFDHSLRFWSAIVEDANTPPQVMVYDQKTQTAVPVSALNSEVAEYARGYVEKMTIATKSGLRTTGFLVHPVNEIPGKRYPLIIATYGFSGKTFITDAEWHSSFPTQVFAADGYMTLLLNHPPGAQGLVGNPEKARELEGWNVLALWERAVDQLDEQGIIDPSKVALYGWSHGAFVVEFCISHSDRFSVACIGEGGDYNPGFFWLSLLHGSCWWQIYENMFGGPPWGQSLQAYLKFSPFFQADKIRAPLLMEFADTPSEALEMAAGLEMYAPLQYRGIPVELVIYPGEDHNFKSPLARIASMRRKVDWVNYWLFGKVDPSNPEQYQRWENMRQKFQEKMEKTQ